MTFQIGQKVIVNAIPATVISVEKKTVTVRFEDGTTQRRPAAFVEAETEFEAPDWSFEKLTSEQVYARKFRRFGGRL